MQAHAAIAAGNRFSANLTGPVPKARNSGASTRCAYHSECALTHSIQASVAFLEGMRVTECWVERTRSGMRHAASRTALKRGVSGFLGKEAGIDRFGVICMVMTPVVISATLLALRMFGH